MNTTIEVAQMELPLEDTSTVFYQLKDLPPPFRGPMFAISHLRSDATEAIKSLQRFLNSEETGAVSTTTCDKLADMIRSNGIGDVFRAFVLELKKTATEDELRLLRSYPI